MRLLAAKQGVGFGFLDLPLPPDTIISNLAVAINKNGGTVTGTVVEKTSGSGSVAKSTTQIRPVSGVEVYAFGGALHDITDSQGVYVIHNMPSEGKVVLYFTLNGKIISMINGVTAPEKGLISMPQLVIGGSMPPKYGFTLTASSITLALNGTTITPRVNVVPVNPGDTIRFARFYWNYDGIPGWDDSTKTSWLDIPDGVFNWQPGDTFTSP